MTKTCPIMSFRDKNYEEIFCGEKECAWWDEERGQCCILTQALAAAGKTSGVSRQAEYVYPVMPNITPVIEPNSSGDWIKPNPYRVDCQEEDIDYSQVVISGMCGTLKDEFKL